MSARATQLGAVQGADEESKGVVHDSTVTAHRSQQRSNVPKSTAGVGGSADEQVSAVRGSLEQYEIAVLYDPDLEIDLDKATGKVEKILTDGGGKITNVDNWGKRKLAYPIKKQDHAVYVFYKADLPADAVRKIESTLNITDEVLRYLVVKQDLKALAKAEEEKAQKAKKAAERNEKTAGEPEEEE